jgi:lipid-A-disaccharide synthase
MMARGMESLFPMDELSVMGLSEILPRYLDLRRRLKETIAEAVKWQPDLLLTIDSPDFTLRAAKAIKPSIGCPVVHYVAPSVWAWRAGRAAKMAGHVDHVLALLPFEPPYMEAAGMSCDFVGHPVVTEPLASQTEAQAFRRQAGIDEAPCLLVLPGSRGSEVGSLLPIFGDAVARVIADRPDTRVVLPAAAGVAEQVGAAVVDWPGTPHVIDMRKEGAETEKRAAFAAADAALAASGTVSLELAANDTPMVIGYAPSRLTWAIASRMVKVDTVTLVNLVSKTRAVPEFLGPDCTPEPLAQAVLELLEGGEAAQAQRDAMSLTMERLGRSGKPPGLRAAESILGFLDWRRGGAT